MADRFSKRFQHAAIEKEITIREDAPLPLREFIVQQVYALGYKPTFLRRVICKVLKVRPDPENWTDYPNVDIEANNLIQNCEWYNVYDVIELLWDDITGDDKLEFQDEVNEYFKSNGIGWKMEHGIIEARGSENFEKTIKVAEKILETAKLQTASTEIKEAIDDLSRRPTPDVTGAIQHSLACLECVCREATGDKKATLGELIKKFPAVVPAPLDKAIEKIWGYSSEQGRHLREGQVPTFEEAELIVSVTAAIATYLGKKLTPAVEDEDTLPF